MPFSSLNPFKKDVVLMSPLKGALLKNGRLLPNTEIEVVIVIRGRKERTYKHQTNENGIFKLPVIEDKITVWPMIEFEVSQFVHVYIDGEKETIWHAAKRELTLFAERHPPSESIGLICDVNNETQSYRENAGFINTKCKWHSLKSYSY